MNIDSRIPPHNEEAEIAVISSLLIDGEAIYNINQFLKVEDFFTADNKMLYEAIVEIMNRGEAVNQITIAHQIKDKEKLAEIGGVAYLSGLIANCPTSAHIEHYARIVKNTAIARRAITAGHKIMAQGFNEPDPNKIVAESEKIILELQKEVVMPKLLLPNDIAQMSIQRYDDLNEGKRRGIYTGFKELDDSLGGLFGGELCYIAGRPGTGKTEILLSISQYVGIRFGNVLLASLEQPWGDITDRLLGRDIEMSPRRIRQGCYPDGVMQRIMEFTGKMAESKLYFYDSGGDIDGRGATTGSIYSIASHMKLAYGISLVVIDYLGLLEDASGEKSYERVSLISRKLKKLARDLDIPVLCAAQLNREVERRIDHKPQISDLRDSGNIEQDADTILFIYRPDKYEEELDAAQKDGRDIKNKASLIIGKQRQGGEVAGAYIPLLWDFRRRCYVGNEHASTIPEQFR
jgi:replicative DNA helicase